MILIIANKNDNTALEISNFISDQGILSEIHSNLDAFDFSMIVENNGEIEVELMHKVTKENVIGIINRGLNTKERSIKSLETLAAIWSLLSCFNGKVINASSEKGFIPFIDNRFLNCDSDLWFAPQKTTSKHLIKKEDLTGLKHENINVHSALNGKYIGKKDTLDLLAEEDIVTLTYYNPSKTDCILISGNDYYMENDNFCNPELLDKLIKRLMQHNINFAKVFCEDHNDNIVINHLSCFPHLNEYNTIKEQVHNSLLNYLLS